MRVPGSNPGGTIFVLLCRLPFIFSFFAPIFLSYFPILFPYLKKQRREVSINRPASYEPAALPLRHPAIHIFFLFFFTLFFPFFTFYSVKSSITGNRTRGTNVKGLYVTNYTTMDNWNIKRKEKHQEEKRERNKYRNKRHKGKGKRKKWHMGRVSKREWKKKDPTNRIRTSDLRKSINNYSPPLYQLSYGRYPVIRE